jgi:hypothetical protein
MSTLADVRFVRGDLRPTLGARVVALAIPFVIPLHIAILAMVMVDVPDAHYVIYAFAIG